MRESNSKRAGARAAKTAKKKSPKKTRLVKKPLSRKTSVRAARPAKKTVRRAATTPLAALSAGLAANDVASWVVAWFRRTFRPPLAIDPTTPLRPLRLGDTAYGALAQSFDAAWGARVTGAQLATVARGAATIGTIIDYLTARVSRP